MTAARRVLLGVNLQGFGQRPAAWRVQDVHPTDLIGPEFWADLGRIAERGRLDAVFFADNPSLGDPNVRALGLIEPFTALQAIADATENLGLVGTASTTYNDPVELAERLLSLDLVSGGRVAWNAVTTYNPAVSGNFGVSGNPDRTTRYARAAEFVDVVTRLWATSGTGRRVDYTGDHVEVHAGLDVPRSAQGQPVVFQAGGSDQGRDLAARFAEGVFSVELTLDAAVENRRLLRAAAASHGRDPDDVRIVPGLSIVLGSTEQEANDLYDSLEALAPDGYAEHALSSYLDVDVTTLDPAQPIPPEYLDRPFDENTYGASVGYRRTVTRWVRENNTSVRALVRGFGGYGARIVVGTPEQVADSIETWFHAGAADGFNLMVDRFPTGLAEIVDHVIPLLQERGLFHREYEEPTLRGRFRTASAVPARASASVSASAADLAPGAAPERMSR
ncbi:NtaA/DmoA family FMN-dependent monooxygenase [Frondihabitans cladoniiphilus]|uniref:LLM class flavin-dependent oxidoreductase n=1 Tax=Frondihabitans cladoniiphilus TaxID=715785 RepID=A0ABP8VUG8_9MICO